MSDEKPDFYLWTDDALVMDATRNTASGPEIVRVTIPKDRLKQLLGNDAAIARWFLQAVVGGVKARVGTKGLSPNLLKNAQSLQKTLQNPDGLFTKPTRVDSVLGPDVLALESMLGVRPDTRTGSIQGHMLPVGPQE